MANTGIITSHYKKFAANKLIQSFYGSDNLYFFIAKNEPWTSETTPPNSYDTVRGIDLDVWRSMYALKRIGPTNISFCIKRVDWAPNIVYAQYRDNDNSLTSENFYVLNDSFNVYKCISNNGGAVSTVKPTGTLTTSFKTSDGYVWKFMFSVSASQAVTFLTPNFVPVQTLTQNDGSYQWAVQASAVPGSIEFIEIFNGGANFYGSVGGIGGATVSTAVVQDTLANNALVGSAIYITNGTGAGQVRTITSYNSTTKVVGVTPNWNTIPDVTSSYEIGAGVTVTGDGTGFVGYGTVTANAVSYINVINYGSGFSFANVSLTANGATGANVYAHMSPRGGHGSDPVSELYGENIIISARLDGSEGNTISIGNDFRVIGLVANPLLANGSPATGTIYDQTTKLQLGSITGTFTPDEQVFGVTSGATADVIDFISPNVRLTNVVGSFANNELVRGSVSLAQGTISSITTPPIKNFTGDVVTIENRTSVVRSGTQAENIVIVIQY